MVSARLWQGQSEADLRLAAEALRQGQLVAFPTETVYGLGANALDQMAAAQIYAAKGRPSDNPLIVHIYDRAQLAQLVREIPPEAEALMDAFWPGPLTLVLPKGDNVPAAVTGGLDTVAVRMPNHAVALALLRLARLPIAAPSANLSGKPSPTTAAHVYHDLHDKIAGIVDGGPCAVGLESTVLDLSSYPPTILRPGAVTAEQIAALLGFVRQNTTAGDSETPKAPGMKYKHYAPNGEITIITGSQEERVQRIAQGLAANPACGLMLSAETLAALPPLPPECRVRNLGSRHNPAEIAHNLFDALRWFDEEKVAVIYTEDFPADNLGQALMNRLNKAAGVQ